MGKPEARIHLSNKFSWAKATNSNKSVIISVYVESPRKCSHHKTGDHLTNKAKRKPLFRRPHYDYDLDESLDDHFFSLESFNRGQGSGRYRNGFHLDFDSMDEDDYGLRRPVATGPAALSGRGLHRLLLTRATRPWRFRGGNRSRNY